MNKADSILIKALKEATEDSFAFADTEEDAEHIFSDRFEKKISKILVWDEMPSYFPKLKNALIAVALVGVLLLFMGCSVPQIRETVQNYFIYSDKYNMMLFWKENVGKDSFEDYYLPSSVPENFLLTDYNINKNGLSALYEKHFQNGILIKIELYQELIPENGLFLQKQDGVWDTIDINSMSMKVYKLYETTTIFYEYDGYMFKIVYYENDDINISDIAEMLSSLKRINPDEQAQKSK